jgi:hypothetical protein
VAYIGGPRESRRLLGDVILKQEDIVNKRQFPDGCVPSTWTIDLHYPKKQYAHKFPDNPFIAIAVHDRRVDRNYGYPVPYRCFYSRNIDNLFMAGRCISVTHEALGTTRVMKTCGMMGEVVGRAASICVLRQCTPRDVFHRYDAQLDELLRLPGKAHRTTVHDPIVTPDDALALAGPYGEPTGLDPAALAGLIVDDTQAEKTGNWTSGTGLKGYVGSNYLYATSDPANRIRFQFQAPDHGSFDIRLAYGSHENRGTRVPITVETASGSKSVSINMKQPAPLEHGFISLGRFALKKDETVAVVISAEDAGGFVHADAVQVVRVE